MVEEDVPSTSTAVTIPSVPRRSGRVSLPTDRYIGMVEESVREDLLLLDSNEPATYRGAMTSYDSKLWLEAMQSKIDSMHTNQVWDLVDLPDKVQPLQCKWLYKIKRSLDRQRDIYKAQLVAKGFTQVQGLHYDQIFAPVMMLRSIRIILAIAAFHDYEIWQMDVKTAFLNGYLEEELYIIQPEGFTDPKYPKKVCKLKRSIYGLKQVSRSWNHRFDEVIKQNGFIQSVEEPCLYIKSSGSIIVFFFGKRLVKEPLPNERLG
ncbi:hypothetical protein vseg_020991 [Gypsophila vaccaria]